MRTKVQYKIRLVTVFFFMSRRLTSPRPFSSSTVAHARGVGGGGFRNLEAGVSGAVWLLDKHCHTIVRQV
uniref:Uncharacterized protein n=1 Tax=Oryza sativa subsp. japonica TaxID=39947 RepID=Q69L06_ORYSJ|nr:hypothetical protein [Oryza sativa Japonica Group]